MAAITCVLEPLCFEFIGSFNPFLFLYTMPKSVLCFAVYWIHGDRDKILLQIKLKHDTQEELKTFIHHQKIQHYVDWCIVRKAF